MDNPYGGVGNWSMVPNVQSHSNTSTPSNQDHMYLLQPQQQQQFQSPQSQQLYQQQRLIQQQQQHQSLASHFRLLPLVEKLAEATENGNRDPQSDALISDLTNHFEKCQQLLNSISGSITSKSTTVEGQKLKVEETGQMLKQRRDMINKYRNAVNELVKSEP